MSGQQIRITSDLVITDPVTEEIVATLKEGQLVFYESHEGGLYETEFGPISTDEAVEA